MKLSIAEPRPLVDSINVISEIVNEVRFKVDKDKIDLVAMDPANVAMVDFKLLSSLFTEYDVPEVLNLCISLDALKSVFKRVKPSDMMSIALDESKSKLKITLKGENTRTFSLALIDVEEKEQKVPELKFTTKIETNSTTFDEAIQDVDVVSDSVIISVQDGTLRIEGDGNTSHAIAEIKNGDETKITTQSKDTPKSRYSVEYLKKIIKGGKLANTVKLQFGEDYPLRVDYTLKDKLNFAVILAPRSAR